MSTQFKNGKCSCWKSVDKMLHQDGTALDLAFSTGGTTYLKLATYRIDGNRRKQPRSVMAAYCPFCGNKLNTD